MSSSNIALEVQQLSKCYHIYSNPRDRLWQTFLRGNKKLYKEFWALRDISFSVQRGEAVAIIGANGSGKSTLLQIIAQTTPATAGEVVANGRVAALLELGAGFNPEFTGRENIQMNGAIMGLSRREIDTHMDDIVEFAEIGEFIDQPVKTYSSGMYVRLAFAGSVSLAPDILIVDEALSVGDIKFQRKCFRRLEELRQQQTSILLVTHATETVINHFDRAILLDKGKLQEIGEPSRVVHAYVTQLLGSKPASVETMAGNEDDLAAGGRSPPSSDLNLSYEVDGCAMRASYNHSEYRWGDQRARIIDYILTCDGETDVATCRQRGALKIDMVVHFAAAAERPVYGLLIRTVEGTKVFGTNSLQQELEVERKQAGDLVKVTFALPADLGTGDYFVSLGVVDHPLADDIVPMDRRYDLIQLVIEGKIGGYGVALLDVNVNEQRLDPGAVEVATN